MTTLNQGQSYHITSGALGTISVGTKLAASGPVQAYMITGDVCDNYESRWYTLYPTERWSSSYYNPVGTPAGDGTTVFLYNPSAAPLSVHWETAAGAQPAINVAPANDEEKQAEVETPIDLDPLLTIKKATNGEDADTPPGPSIQIGAPITWTYVVRNTGPVTATNITVTDNVAGVTPTYVSGDTNNNQVLEQSETWTYQATGIAVAGQYSNTGTVRGTRQ